MENHQFGELFMKNRELIFWDYLAILVKWRKLIVINFLIVCFAASGISLILPKWYRSQATLLPPIEQTSSPFGLVSMLSDIPLGELGVPGMRTPLDLFKAILESRTVGEAVVKRLNLQGVYKKKTLEDAVRVLWKRIQMKTSPEGTISIVAEDRSPERAAGIANAFVEELDRVNQTTSTSQAKNTRIFIEKRLEETIANLQDAEESLRMFQEQNKTVSLTDQIAAIIQSAAELKAKQVALEIEKEVRLKVMSSAHPEIMRLQAQIEEFQKQLDKLLLVSEKLSGSNDQSSDQEDFMIPLAKVPSLGLQMARLVRDVKIQEAIFELLTQQYERAKIEETKDTPTVQVLDWAVPPGRRSRPRRMIFVFFMGLLSLFLSMVSVFTLEYYQRLRAADDVRYHQIRKAIEAIKKDLARLRIGVRS
jgi:tyrosine-protein kinase Etk/Wzc